MVARVIFTLVGICCLQLNGWQIHPSVFPNVPALIEATHNSRLSRRDIFKITNVSIHLVFIHCRYIVLAIQSFSFKFIL
jgi:hypothetical protein